LGAKFQLALLVESELLCNTEVQLLVAGPPYFIPFCCSEGVLGCHNECRRVGPTPGCPGPARRCRLEGVADQVRTIRVLSRIAVVGSENWSERLSGVEL